MLCLLVMMATGQEVRTISNTDFDGINITRSDTFTGQSLYGYIDGGADLFLEYGFVRLYVNEYQWNGETLQTEIWVMEDAPSAYGIYALSHSSCIQWDMVSAFSCSSRYQVSAVQGPLYVSVTDQSGNPSAQAGMTDLARRILELNPQESWYMPSLFQDARLQKYLHSIRYFEGPLGLQNGLPVMEDLLDNLPFRMYTILTDHAGSPSMIAHLSFPNAESTGTFLSRARLNPSDRSSQPVLVSDGLYRSWCQLNSNTILYLESRSDTVRAKSFAPLTPETEWPRH